ncbi:MAG: hypothetical protein E7505_05735 [Ruminococcus sp.]|nr:hypothetical protein [Ruminococcus sp.]
MEKQLNFLKEITRRGTADDFHTDISEIKSIMNTYLPEIFLKTPELYVRLSSEYRRLKEYSAYPQLAKKTIVSLCGKSSVGKSSFFNSLYNGGIVPVDMSSGCSVPIYIVCGRSGSVFGINKFDHLTEMDPLDMKTVFSGKKADDLPPLSHLFSSILTFASAPELKHVAFLDTPGYNSPASGDTLFRTDESALVDHLNLSNYILWFADVNILSLGISDNDIETLKKLDPSIPKLIIISKADAFTQKDFPEIIEKVKKTLNAKGVSYIDVLAYSKLQPEKYDKYKILAYLDRWDKNPTIINFSQRFEEILSSVPASKLPDGFRQKLLPEIKKAGNSIYNIQNAFEQKNSKSEEEFVPVDSVPKKSNPLKNIDISRIKISDLPIPNPEKLFRNYNDKNVLDMSAYERYINSVSIIFTEKMKDIVPVFSDSLKNTLYKKHISGIMMNVFKDIYSNEPEASADNNDQDTEKKKESAGRRQKPLRSRRGAEKNEKTEKPDEAASAGQPDAPPVTPTRRERPTSGASRRRFR